MVTVTVRRPHASACATVGNQRSIVAPRTGDPGRGPAAERVAGRGDGQRVSTARGSRCLRQGRLRGTSRRRRRYQRLGARDGFPRLPLDLRELRGVEPTLYLELLDEPHARGTRTLERGRTLRRGGGERAHTCILGRELARERDERDRRVLRLLSNLHV